MRAQVQSRSYGARRNLIEAPLKELDLDITPRVGWVRDPRLTEPETLSEKNTGIVAAFASSKRRLLIVGEPGSGKTMAAYALIEHLDVTEGDERMPLLVNLSAWGAQDDFEAFLVDYLVSEVGYQVRQRTVASAFIGSRRYTLILDGLDEIPAGLRKQFTERLDEFVRGLPSEVAVVVTCRTQEYEELLATHPTGLGLVQAVEMLPLTSEQLDRALAQLARFDDKAWETFLAQRHLTASQQARDLLRNPLFLNLAVAGRLRPGELLNCDEERELSDLVLERYLDRIQADQSEYEPKDIHRYLTWIARFLNGAEVSPFGPFGLKTTDSTVFNLANLTPPNLDLANLAPPDPSRRYQLFVARDTGLRVVVNEMIFGGMAFGLYLTLVRELPFGVHLGVIMSLVALVAVGLVLRLLAGWPYKRPAVSSRLSLVWPSTRQQLLGFLSSAGHGLRLGLVVGVIYGLVYGLVHVLVEGVLFGLVYGLVVGVAMGLAFGVLFGLVYGLVEPRSMLTTSCTPKEASSRSLIAALIWLVVGLVSGLVLGLIYELSKDLAVWLIMGLLVGLGLGLRNGGWFVLLQRVAHRRLAKAGNLPPRPADFLEWGIERQIFRRVPGRGRSPLSPQPHPAALSQHLSRELA